VPEEAVVDLGDPGTVVVGGRAQPGVQLGEHVDDPLPWGQTHATRVAAGLVDGADDHRVIRGSHQAPNPAENFSYPHAYGQHDLPGLLGVAGDAQ
jgi:hypothetical protein